MTHRKFFSFTCFSLLLTACGGGSVLEDTSAPCPDADADGQCDDDDTETSTGQGGDIRGAGGAGGSDGVGGAGGSADLCEGDDATGDTDADGICDDLDACAGDDATGDDDADFVCNDLDQCHGDDATGDSDGSGTCDDAVAAMAGTWTLTSSGGNLGGSAPMLGDVDGDGDLDIVTRIHNGRRLVQWTNTSGAFSESGSVSTSAKPLDHDLADLDADGDLDFIAGGVASNRLVVRENQGEDGFGGQIFLSTDHFSSVLAMPVDGDTKPDIVGFNKSTQELVVSLNVSDNNGLAFAAPTVIDAVSSNSFTGPGLTAVDVDADGDLDLVVATNDLRLYVNNGGTFAAPISVDTGNLGSRLYKADLDGDGDEDVLGLRLGKAVWYENLGDGNLGARQDIAEGDFSRLAVGDLDGDGDTDVVVRSANNDDLIWVENGRNGLVVRAPIGTASGDFVVGDLDRDGDGDVATIDGSINGLAILSNPLF